jgi:hypothetical protein
MKEFKFFQNTDDDEDESIGAGWMWSRLPPFASDYLLFIRVFRGIRSFLSQFPPHSIINVIEIEGPNGVAHNMDNNNEGWGFDITSEMITITWIVPNR